MAAPPCTKGADCSNRSFHRRLKGNFGPNSVSIAPYDAYTVILGYLHSHAFEGLRGELGGFKALRYSEMISVQTVILFRNIHVYFILCLALGYETRKY